MKRGTRRIVTQLCAFGSVLFLLLLVAWPRGSQRSFDWTHIRYQAKSIKSVAASGTCPGLANSSKPALVVARVTADGNQGWLKPLEDKYHQCIYTVDQPTEQQVLSVPANRGNEAMVYLTFLIDNYDSIPEAGAVFVHGKRWAWHNDAPDYDNQALLSALNFTTALEPYGYHNLRCDWSASTCPPSTPPQRSFETSMRAIMEPWNARVLSDKALPHAISALFGHDDQLSSKDQQRLLVDRSSKIRSQCCAQFVVARGSIWQHTREEYIALRQWLIDGTDALFNEKGAAPRDNLVAGRDFVVSMAPAIHQSRTGQES